MALLIFRRAVMKAQEEVEPRPQKESNRPQVWAREPAVPANEPKCAPSEDDEAQVIEEPGYGHGV
jgi:hypothetical protein